MQSYKSCFVLGSKAPEHLTCREDKTIMVGTLWQHALQARKSWVIMKPLIYKTFKENKVDISNGPLENGFVYLYKGF